MLVAPYGLVTSMSVWCASCLLPTGFIGDSRSLDIIHCAVETLNVLRGIQASGVIVKVGDHPGTSRIKWNSTPVMSRAYLFYLLQKKTQGNVKLRISKTRQTEERSLEISVIIL